MKIDPPPPNRPTGKVFDVMRPGKAPASSTSKPVIVGHKPEIKDPAVTVNGVGEARELMHSRKNQIVPASERAAQLMPISPTAKPAEVTLPTQPVDDLAQPLPEAPTGEAKIAEEFALGEAVVEGSGDVQLDDHEFPAADLEHQGVVVSHHQIGGSQFVKMIMLIGIMIFLALVAIDIVLDADMVHWNLPHTNLL